MGKENQETDEPHEMKIPQNPFDFLVFFVVHPLALATGL
jgi:hypothetical protein